MGVVQANGGSHAAPPGLVQWTGRKTFNMPQRGDALRNIEAACKRGLPFFKVNRKSRHAPAVIVGGGPSIKNEVETIRALKGRVICMNDSLTFLLDHGIKPWGCVFWEIASTAVAKYFDNPPEGVNYLLASQSHGDAFEALRDRKVTVWHAWQGIGEEHVILPYSGRTSPIVMGGCSAALRTINLARLMGHRNIHLFGVDSSADGATHAYKDDGLDKYQDVYCAGQWFKSIPYWMRQAQDFAEYVDFHRHAVRLTVHGDGLLPHMARQLGVHASNRSEAK